jgi:hypothetical protein
MDSNSPRLETTLPLEQVLVSLRPQAALKRSTSCFQRLFETLRNLNSRITPLLLAQLDRNLRELLNARWRLGESVREGS